jgi:transposase
VEGSINAEKYIDNCDRLNFIEELDALNGPVKWIFQQDGAVYHTTQVVLDWLEESFDVLHGWPANSPDLSPIELLWAILKKAIALLKPTTLEELRAALQISWDSIPQITIDRLCQSFRSRLEICRNREGLSIPNDFWLLSDKACIADLDMI